MLIWHEQIPEVRPEVNKVNSSGNILAGTDIIFPDAILPELQTQFSSVKGTQLCLHSQQIALKHHTAEFVMKLQPQV